MTVVALTAERILEVSEPRKLGDQPGESVLGLGHAENGGDRGLLALAEQQPRDVPRQAKLAALLALVRESAGNVGSVQDSTWQAALDAGWSDTELTEVSVYIAFNLFTNHFAHMVETDLDLPAASGL